MPSHPDSPLWRRPRALVRTLASTAVALVVAVSLPAAALAAAPAGNHRGPEVSISSDPYPITLVPGTAGKDRGPDSGPDAGPDKTPGTDDAGSSPTASSPCLVDFSDVAPRHTFYLAVTWLACAGLTNGYSDGSFGVGKDINRGEAITLLYRMSGDSHQAGASIDYPDVQPSHFAFTAVSWAREKGITQGYSDGTFGVGQDINRGELATFMLRAAGIDDYTPPATSPYSDMQDQRHRYFFGPAAWLQQTGMITGYADGSFRPGRPITRGESAKFLYALQTYQNGGTPPAQPVTPPKPYVPPVKPTAVYLKVTTSIYQSNSFESRKLKTLPAQAALTKVSAQGAMTKVTSGTTTGWVNSDFLTAGQPGTTAKRYPKPKTYLQHANNNMAKWCWDVPLSTIAGYGGGFASYRLSLVGDNDDALDVQEAIELGDLYAANSGPSVATQLHECGHILQFRAYKYDYEALVNGMDTAYPNNGSGIPTSEYHSGVEHMADCIADAMGAQRTGMLDPYTTYYSGYGGKCTSAHLAKARTIIAGKRP
ncbi:S-layer homology domain-containing protein [Citricoccus sp. NPDC055426]|uniref:S-layer homology domain-containing protein n=1 Tax=Citricoccus sp. NPDC055426 TaxID=3155536 RepID=UPI0034166539